MCVMFFICNVIFNNVMLFLTMQTIADLQKRENARQTSAMVLMPRIPEQVEIT